MNVIVFSRPHGQARQFNLRHPVFIASSVLGIAAFLSISFAGGYLYAARNSVVTPDAQLAEWADELDEQRREIDAARRDSEENVDALAMRVGQLNAHIIRINALGQRLTKMADLDDGEFDFANAPAQGGPESLYDSPPVALPALTHMLDGLADQVASRERQLDVLENYMLNRDLDRQALPKGRPIRSGWISSYFGTRTDPFTGRPARHSGVDFAGRAGSQVIAVAPGVVTWSRDRYGYGNMVEVSHGNGYVTRYAHNSANLVAVGDRVAQGQPVALMGSTGRATGPNLHFEVLHNGLKVNPLKYIQDVN
ncbi:MAG TPA: M23 family metallopeptidase [Gammaproteobacteria bacterium]|nr:M23 family metallopeptidase [Gammaproteobacteria bacterium]